MFKHGMTIGPVGNVRPCCMYMNEDIDQRYNESGWREKFDELYDKIFVAPAVKIGKGLWLRGDKGTIDYFGPDGMSAMVHRISRSLVQFQTGYVYHYAFAMMIGVVILVSWYFSGFGGR